MRAAIGLACLAACGGGAGVDIQITVEDGVHFDAVELYIAYDPCATNSGQPCPGIGWPMSADTVDGPVYTMRDKIRVRSDVLRDGDGVLHLEAAPGFADPKAIAIVAFDGHTAVGGWVIHGPHIPSHSGQRWAFRLKKTDVASTDLSDPGEASHFRAFAWPREVEPATPEPNATLADYAGCFAFQAWDGNAWTTEFFVPPDDPDCDGAPPDCNPFWNHAPSRAARCVTESTSGATNPCVLGDYECADESSTACKDSSPRTCIPSELCFACKDSDATKACIADHVAPRNPPGVTSVACDFTIDPLAQGRYGCENGGAGEKMFFTLPHGCNPPALNVPIGGLRPYDNIFAPDSTTLTLGTAKIGIKATPSTNLCSVELTWQANTLAPADGSAVLVSLWFGSRQIVFPVFVGFNAGMTSYQCMTLAGACDVGQGGWPDGTMLPDSMFGCVN